MPNSENLSAVPIFFNCSAKCHTMIPVLLCTLLSSLYPPFLAPILYSSGLSSSPLFLLMPLRDSSTFSHTLMVFLQKSVLSLFSLTYTIIYGDIINTNYHHSYDFLIVFFSLPPSNFYIWVHLCCLKYINLKLNHYLYLPSFKSYPSDPICLGQ